MANYLRSKSSSFIKPWSSSSTRQTYTSHIHVILASIDIFLKANGYDTLQRDIYRWCLRSIFATLNLKLFIGHPVKIRFLPSFCHQTKKLLCEDLLWTMPNLLRRSCQHKNLRHLGSMCTPLIGRIIFTMYTSLVCVNMS
jgi:hypothetical protein